MIFTLVEDTLGLNSLKTPYRIFRAQKSKLYETLVAPVAIESWSENINTNWP